MAITKVSTELLKDNSVTINKLHSDTVVTVSKGLHNHVNDNGIPTAGAVASYVSSQVTGANNWDLSFAWGDHSTYGYATEAYVDNSIANVINSAPAALDTLNELAAALGDDPNFATTVSNSIGTAQSTANTALTNANAALAKDPTLTISGDASGSATFTNLGNATLSLTIADDSHNHIISNIDGLQSALDGKQTAGTYNTIIGTDSDINTSGATIVDNIYVTDGVITSMGTRTLTLGDLGYTGATNANYITNNNQLTNGAGYITFNDTNANSNHLNSTRDTPNDSLQYWQASGLGTTEAPSTDWHNTIRMGHGDPLSYYSNTLAIRMTGTGVGDIYTQTIAGGSAQGWKKHWNNGNDGSGSGLDADLLDGLQGSQFLRSDTDDTATGKYIFSQTASTMGGSNLNNATILIGNTSQGIGIDNNEIHGSGATYIGTNSGDLVFRPSGLTLSQSNIHAPAFYDSNNTGYYVDPAGANRLHSIVVGDGTPDTTPAGTTFSNTIKSTNGSNRVVNFEGVTSISTWYTVGNTAYGAIDQNDTYMAFWQHHGLGWSEQFRIYRGYQTSLNSLRAPIFYDSNDTSYYLNPAQTGPEALKLNGGISINSSHSDGNIEVKYLHNGSTTDANSSNIAMGVSEPGLTYHGAWIGCNINRSSPYYGRAINSNYGAYIRWDKHSGVTQFKTTTSTAGAGGGQGGVRFEIYPSGITTSTASSRAPIFYDSDDTTYFLNPATTGDSIRVAGDIVAYYSDERLKDIKGNIENAVDKVKQLNGFYYSANETAQKLGYKVKDEVGVSAQEVEKVLPEIIKEAPIGQGYKTLDYSKIVPLLIEAIKEQQTQIDELKQLINKQ